MKKNNLVRFAATKQSSLRQNLNTTKILHVPIITSALTYLLVLNTAISLGQAGSLDLSFDADGKVTTSFQSDTYAGGRSSVIQQDGKIVVAGYFFSGFSTDFAVVRYNTNGTLDNTFSSDGTITTDIAGHNDEGYEVVIQQDGKIVVAGYSYNGSNYDFAVVRYKTDGTLDNTFSSDGIVTTDIGGDDDIAYSVTQQDGKIVLAGYSHNDYSESNDFAVVRYNTDGTLDGIVTTDIAAYNDDIGDDIGYSVAVQDGKIVVAGYSYYSYKTHFTVVRYNTNGTLDNTFSSDGIVTTDIGSYNLNEAHSIAIQRDGKIVVAGAVGSSFGPNDGYVVVRYNANGTLDNTFSSDGMIIIDIFSSGVDEPSIAIQQDGKIVASFYSSTGSNEDFEVVRYNANGTLDNSFSSDGMVTTNVGSTFDEAHSISIQQDGKIVVAGQAVNDFNFGPNFAVVRYNANGTLDNTFNSDGIVTTDFEVGGAVNGQSVTIQQDGKIVIAGYVDGLNDDFALVL